MKTKLFTGRHQRYAASLNILYRSLLFLALMLFVSYAAEANVSADSGAIRLTVIDKSNNEVIPFANVIAYQNGVQVAVGTTNMDGEFLFKHLALGKYDLKAVYVGYDAQEIKGVDLAANRTSSVTLKLNGGDNLIVCYDICYCCCGGYNAYGGEDWWPKLWTPYREGYKAWKEKKEKKKALAAKQAKKKEVILSEEPDETETVDSTLMARVQVKEPILEQIKIYPNPASEVLHIESTRPLQNIIVMDEDGKIVREEQMQSSATDIKLNGFANGIYYLHYVLDGKSESRKIVVITQ